MTNRRPLWPQCVIASHLAIVLVTGYALAVTHSDLRRVVLSLIAGTSLFVLSNLLHAASHYQLARPVWLNDLLGNLAGMVLATPVSAYRALHMKHHQTTNREDDPFIRLSSRWMILFGTPTAVLVIHAYAWRHLRGRALGQYLIETLAIYVVLAATFFLPRPIREWSLFGPLIVVALFHNIQNVWGHLDLPAGKYHDTWQLVLPRWISVWMLNVDHHLEHHICPRMHWYELPDFRAELALKPELGLHRVTVSQFLIEVLVRGAKLPRLSRRSIAQSIPAPHFWRTKNRGAQASSTSLIDSRSDT